MNSLTQFKSQQLAYFKQMNSLNPLTQLKNQVENKKHKKYQHIKDTHNHRYFELYLNKITFIQRQWRRYLVRKGKRLERIAIQATNQLSDNKLTNQNLMNRLKQLKSRKKQLENLDPNIYAQIQKQKLQNQLKTSINNVLQGADRYAKIKAVLQSQMMSYNQIMKENESLKKTCKQGVVMTEALREKNNNLSKKIKQLRGIIAEQKTDIMLLKQTELKLQ